MQGIRNTSGGHGGTASHGAAAHPNYLRHILTVDAGHNIKFATMRCLRCQLAAYAGKVPLHYMISALQKLHC